MYTSQVLYIDDINIDTNVIPKYSTPNADLELRTNGSGAIIIDDFIIKANRIETASSDMVFVPGSGTVNVNPNRSN